MNVVLEAQFKFQMSMSKLEYVGLKRHVTCISEVS